MKEKVGEFTFSMPLPGQGENGSINMQVDKLPSPPLSLVASRGEEGYIRTAEVSNSNSGESVGQGISAYSSPSSGTGDSQASPGMVMDSVSPNGSAPQVFNPEPYNAFITSGSNAFADLAQGGNVPLSPGAEALQTLSTANLQELLEAFRNQQEGNVQGGQEASGLTPFGGYRDNLSPGGINPGYGEDFDLNDNDMNGLFRDEAAMNLFLRSLSQVDEPSNDQDDLPLPLTQQQGPAIQPWVPTELKAPAGMSFGSDLFGSYMLKGFKGTPNGFSDTNAMLTVPANASGSGSNSTAEGDAGFSPSKYLTSSPGAIGSGSSTSPSGAGPTAKRSSSEECPFVDALKVGTMPLDDSNMYRVQARDGRMMSTKEMWDELHDKVDVSNACVNPLLLKNNAEL